MTATNPVLLIPLSLIAASLVLSPFASLHAQDAPKGGGEEIHELAQISAELPHQVLLKFMNNAGNKQAAATEGTAALRQKVEGRMATLKFRLTDKSSNPYFFQVVGVSVRQGVTASFGVHFNSENDKGRIARLRQGDLVTARGKITHAWVSPVSGTSSVGFGPGTIVTVTGPTRDMHIGFTLDEATLK